MSEITYKQAEFIIREVKGAGGRQQAVDKWQNQVIELRNKSIGLKESIRHVEKELQKHKEHIKYLNAKIAFVCK